MRTGRRRSKNRAGSMAIVILSLLILSGVGAGAYLWKPWENGWAFPVKPVRQEAAQLKEEKKEPVVQIQSVSVKNAVALVRVQGKVKLDAAGKSIFDNMNGLQLEPQKRFGYNEWFAALHVASPPEVTYSYLASLLYEAAMKSGFQSGERYLHLQLPDYASPGFDVYAVPDSNNMTLYNPNDTGAVVQISYADDVPVLTIATEPAAGWKAAESSVTQTRYAPEQTNITDGSLQPGSQSERSEGKEGVLIEVSIGGRKVSSDFYLPQPTIVARGLTPADKSSDQLGKQAE